jgi:hypothetical protein
MTPLYILWKPEQGMACSWSAKLSMLFYCIFLVFLYQFLLHKAQVLLSLQELWSRRLRFVSFGLWLTVGIGFWYVFDPAPIGTFIPASDGMHWYCNIVVSDVQVAFSAMYDVTANVILAMLFIIPLRNTAEMVKLKTGENFHNYNEEELHKKKENLKLILRRNLKVFLITLIAHLIAITVNLLPPGELLVVLNSLTSVFVVTASGAMLHSTASGWRKMKVGNDHKNTEIFPKNHSSRKNSANIIETQVGTIQVAHAAN